MGRYVITTPPLSLARQLWRLGEPELADRAAALTPREAAQIGARAGELCTTGQVAELWPGGPGETTAALMLAAIEHLEGAARPCARVRRLPQRQLPPALQATADQLWEASSAVAVEMDQMLAGMREAPATPPRRRPGA